MALARQGQQLIGNLVDGQNFCFGSRAEQNDSLADFVFPFRAGGPSW